MSCSNHACQYIASLIYLSPQSANVNNNNTCNDDDNALHIDMIDQSFSINPNQIATNGSRARIWQPQQYVLIIH